MAEGSGYGMVYTADTAKKQLLESNRDYNNRLTWQNLYNENTLAASRAENQLVKQYTDASAAAYVSYMQNQNAIRNSNIVGAGRQSLLNENQQALMDAYSSYRSNLQEGTSAIQSAAAEQEANITSALEKQAQYTADYTNAHYDYLVELYNRYQNGENSIFDENGQWYKYTTIDPTVDEEGNYVFDEEGNIVYDEANRRLKNWDELVNPAYEEVTNPDGTITKEYTSLFDENGNLTIAGVDFFDQLENQIANEGTGYSWGNYLSETNPELYDWSTSYNPYNYTMEGTNAGTLRTMYGMMSTDYTYEFAERMGGLTTNQINEKYSKFTELSEQLEGALNSLGTVGGKLSDNQIHKTIQSSVSEVYSLMDEMGIKDELDTELKETYGITLNELETNIQEYVLNSYNSGDIAAGSAGAGAGTGAIVGGAGAGTGLVAGGVIGTGVGLGMTIAGATSVAGAASGAVAGMAAGPIGAVIGAVVGVVAGVIVGAVETGKVKNEMKKQNYQSARNLQSLYNNLLSSLTNYSAYKKREAEINFTKNNIY